MAEPHQPPYSLQPPPPQQHQSMAPWYGMSPHMYQTQQAPAPPPPHHAMAWTAASMLPPPPPGDQAYSYPSQQYHVPPQGDFYPRPQQVHHHYPPPPQPAQPQFTYMYGQQDQVWHQANNNWGYQQWPHPAQTTSLSQEEVWAAKARAWAASKAVQDESRPSPNVPQQSHQDYMFQPQEQHPPGGPQHSLQPPGQEVASIHSYQSNIINQGQSAQLRAQSEHLSQSLGYGQSTQDSTSSITQESVLESFEQKANQAGAQSHANDSQSLFGSSQVHDAAAKFGLDSVMTGPQGNEPLSKKPPAAPVYSQQATHLLPQSQASPLISQPHLPYPDKLSTAGYEQQQVPSNYVQPPPPPPNAQQPPPQVPHQPQKLPLQSHYQASGALDGVEGEFGLSPGSLQNWAPVGGPGMPFPPAMGAGTSQFDPIHTPHQLPVPWRPDGSGLQGLGFPSSAPFVVGTSPGLGPGAGPPVRPLFAPDGFVERPKKAAVPSWLREELMKKKAAGLTGTASGMLSSDESSRVNGGEPANSLGQRVGVSDKLRSSSPGLSEDEEEDQEAEIEAARSAAINQEIKRLLTEVLLKVTGDLFKEIAQEVLEEDSDDMLQGSTSPDERSRVGSLTSPLSTNVGPPPLSGRVFVSSGKNPVPEDPGRDKESSDSGEPAGDVLGLGNYASDDETLEPKDHEAAPRGLSTDTEKHDVVTASSVHQAKFEENAVTLEGKRADGPLQSNEHLHQWKVTNEDITVQETSVKQKSTANHIDVQNGKLPVAGDLGASQIQVSNLTSKEIAVQSQLVSEQSSSKERSSSILKGEGKSRDTLTMSIQVKEPAGHNSDTSFKKPENKEASFSQDNLIGNRKREEKREDRSKDLSNKERKRDDKPTTEHKSRDERDDRPKAKSDTSCKERHLDERSKDSKEVKRTRGSESRGRDSSRERRKEKDKVKEKSKPRERESDRDGKRQEKREREGRLKRGEAAEKKARHRSTSSSGREGSSSSNSDRSRGRLRTRRSSRHITSSPGRSRKRRASRSRSRSRSPHVKHTHRRNVPSPSHEKSRRSGSKSPVHRRGRG
ncbi:hypothetical protein GOP47_0013335 [Adiantum capillus-veneris]|uniref:Uncharacterized protein n=1 Tax=Adiantum capillus-veneris TaxID=13818 RepID=A0A9D4UNW5_ADICA|nr:hypothetical protein GOP47_0013335 [Adiantum capillus-veneris]